VTWIRPSSSGPSPSSSWCSSSRPGGGGRSRPGPGTIGTVYDWLNEDKRKAIEIIVEERAGARDPEDKDGNLPDLEEPTRSRPQ
jgi:hypothetical protein